MKNQRNVRVTVELDLFVPDLEIEEMKYGKGLTSDAEDRVDTLIHETFGVGDPRDELDAVILTKDISLLEPESAGA